MHHTRTPKRPEYELRLGRACGIAALVVAATACSSGGGSAAPTSSAAPTTTIPVPTSSTLPAAQVGPAVRAFFDGKGKALIAFERATDEILDQPMTIERCRHYTDKVLPTIATSPNTLRSLANEIPDPRTAYLMGQDVAYKDIFLVICIGKKPIAQRGVDYLQGVHAELLRRLASFGVTV